MTDPIKSSLELDALAQPTELYRRRRGLDEPAVVAVVSRDTNGHDGPPDEDPPPPGEAVTAPQPPSSDPEPDPAERIRSLFARVGARVLAAVSTAAPRPRMFGRYVVDGHTIVYGKGGAGKGMLLAWDIGRLVLAGHRVLLVDYENHPGEWARRIAALHGTGVLEDVLIVTPLDRQTWTAPAGAIWTIAPVLRDLADEFSATWVVVDSVGPACYGAEMNAPGTPRQYGEALAIVGRPTVSIGQVNRAGDLRYPFGSIFWRYEARGTWSIETAPGSTGHQMLVTDTKANNHARAERMLVEVTYLDDLPRSVAERSYALALTDQIVVVLGDAEMTATEIVAELDADSDDDVKVRPDTVRHALRRGLLEPGKRFTVSGLGRTAKWRAL